MSLKGKSALPRFAGILGVASLLVLGLSVSPAMAQGSWGMTVTYGSTLQPGSNQLITALITFNGVMTDPAAVNGTLLTPQGAAVTLNGFVEVTTGVWQTLYQVPNEAGSYEFAITAFNETDTVTSWGTFSAVASDAGSLSTISSSIGSVQGNLSSIQSMLTSLSNSIQSSDTSLSGQITSGNQGVQSTLSSMVSQMNNLASGISSLSSTLNDTQYYALGALVVAFFAFLMAAYASFRKH
jgi:hypothetical protein